MMPAVKTVLTLQKYGGQLRAQFPGVREEIVKFVIYKLALEQGCFYNA